MTIHSFLACALCAALPFVANAKIIGPSVGEVVAPVSVNVGTPVTISVPISGITGNGACKLFVDGSEIGPMVLSGNTASRSHVFSGQGVPTVFVFCRGGNGGMSSSPNVSFVVSPSSGGSGGGTTVDPTPKPEEVLKDMPEMGSLVKIPCGEGAKPDDPCTAVYYYGQDGSRHAFPSDKVYFTWFKDFDAVLTVDPSVLEKMPLGRNITYQPGSKLVKFVSMDNVFFVSPNNTLRWISTEEVAVNLYGSEWKLQVDDIQDAFFDDYLMGDPIKDAAEIDLRQLVEAPLTLDQLFK